MNRPEPRPREREDPSRVPAPPLSAEHEALLRVVLVHGRTYAAVAEFLGRSEEEVRRDVHRAIEVRFGVSTTGRGERGRILDRLLGQRDASSDVTVGRILADDAGQRLWAESVARSLGRPAPRPVVGTLRAGEDDDEDTAVAGPPAAPRPARVLPASTEGSIPPSTALDHHPKPWWRTGTAVVAAALLAGVLLFVVGVVVVSGDGGEDPTPAAAAPAATAPAPDTAAAAATPSTGTTTGAAASSGTSTRAGAASTGYQAFSLADPDGPTNGAITARASISDYRGRPTIAISGAGAQANKGNVYALWLQRPSRRYLRLGDLSKVGTNGSLAGAAAIPAGVPAKGSVVVTLDPATGARTKPGQLVLSGPLPAG